MEYFFTLWLDASQVRLEAIFLLHWSSANTPFGNDLKTELCMADQEKLPKERSEPIFFSRWFDKKEPIFGRIKKKITPIFWKPWLTKKKSAGKKIQLHPDLQSTE